jgi:hypothetical protein
MFSPRWESDLVEATGGCRACHAQAEFRQLLPVPLPFTRLKHVVGYCRIPAPTRIRSGTESVRAMVPAVGASPMAGIRSEASGQADVEHANMGNDFQPRRLMDCRVVKSGRKSRLIRKPERTAWGGSWPHSLPPLHTVPDDVQPEWPGRDRSNSRWHLTFPVSLFNITTVNPSSFPSLQAR